MHRTRRWFAILTGVFTIVVASAGASFAQARQPNIVIIVGDDMGYADIGVHGCKDIPTPNIDSLAKSGRAIHQRLRHRPVLQPDAGRAVDRPLSAAVRPRVQPRRRRRAQRRTAAERDDDGRSAEGGWLPDRAVRQMAPRIGRASSSAWRAASTSSTGSSAARIVLRIGAERRESSLDGREPSRSETVSDRRVRPIAPWRSSNGEKARPFFLYLAFNAVHTPMHAAEKYLARFSDIADEQRRTYAAMMSAMDDGIGRTLAKLREPKAWRRTR